MKVRWMRGTFALAMIAALSCLAIGTTTRAFAGGPAPNMRGSVPCHTVVLEGGLVCYAPRAQATAEAQLAVPPINPDGVVQAATHLRLTQLRLFFGYRRNGGVNLLYAFGSVCWHSEFACSTRYLVVGEAPGPSPVAKARLVRDRMVHSRVTTYGPWKYLAPVPGRHLVITVYGPFPKATIKTIGQSIVRLARVKAGA